MILKLAFEWFMPSTKQYYQQLDKIIHGLSDQQDPKLVHRFKLIIYYLLFESTRITLYCLPLTKNTRLALSDLSLILQTGPVLNFFLVLAMLMVAYMYKSYYLGGICILTKPLVDIILNNNADFFIQNIDSGKSKPPVLFIKDRLKLLVRNRNFYINILRKNCL